jgi:hypothetical protein
MQLLSPFVITVPSNFLISLSLNILAMWDCLRVVMCEVRPVRPNRSIVYLSLQIQERKGASRSVVDVPYVKQVVYYERKKVKLFICISGFGSNLKLGTTLISIGRQQAKVGGDKFN